MQPEIWEPASPAGELSQRSLAELLAASEHLDEPAFGLADADVLRLGQTARLPAEAWAVAGALPDDALVRLVRLYVLAEARSPAWKAGAASPVIHLRRLLCQRDAWPADLTAWIKSHTDNRFLPYGSLMDRLQGNHRR